MSWMMLTNGEAPNTALRVAHVIEPPAQMEGPPFSSNEHRNGNREQAGGSHLARPSRAPC